MRTIEISAKAKTVNALLRQAQRTNLILRTADGFEFILAEIDDFNREIELTRKNKKLMTFLARRAKETKTVSAAEARIRLGLSAAVSPGAQQGVVLTAAPQRTGKRSLSRRSRSTR
ncbi:MAG: hypothetical protein HC853_10150 [Anaerolineae bacterium]|nr:hypothetical protein [Anaerolineae bacterium]